MIHHLILSFLSLALFARAEGGLDDGLAGAFAQAQSSARHSVASAVPEPRVMTAAERDALYSMLTRGFTPEMNQSLEKDHQIQVGVAGGSFPNGDPCHVVMTLAVGETKKTAIILRLLPIAALPLAEAAANGRYLFGDLNDEAFERLKLDPSGNEIYDPKYLSVDLNPDSVKIVLDEGTTFGVRVPTTFEISFHPNGKLKSFSIEGVPFLSEIIRGGARLKRRCEFPADAHQEKTWVM